MNAGPRLSTGPGDTRGASAAPRRRGLLGSSATRGLGLLLAVGALAATVAASLALGTRPVPLSHAWSALLHAQPPDPEWVRDHAVVRGLRIPRTVLGLAVGAALGVSGTLIQGLTRNPLADPGILGVQAGASLAVVLGLSQVGITTPSGYVWFGFVGAAGAGAVVYGLGTVGRGGASPVKLALAGAALTALLTALTSAVLLADQATLDEYRFWAVGSLAGRDGRVVASVLPFLLGGLVLGLTRGRALNSLALGDDVARSLGVRLGWARLTSALGVIVLCGAAVAGAGPIIFVGLVVPHVARAVCGPDYRWVLAWSAVLGPILLLAADTTGRLVARPGEVQVGIMTAVVGAPFFIALVRRRRLAEI